jgi:hypothetical protein
MAGVQQAECKQQEWHHHHGATFARRIFPILNDGDSVPLVNHHGTDATTDFFRILTMTFHISSLLRALC